MRRLLSFRIKVIFSILLLIIYLLPKNAIAAWHTTIATSGFEQSGMSYWCWLASAKNCAISKYSANNITRTQYNAFINVKGTTPYNVGGSLYDIKSAYTYFASEASWAYANPSIYYDVLSKPVLQEIINNHQIGTILAMKRDNYNNGVYINTDYHATMYFAYNVNSNNTMHMKVYEPSGGDIVNTTYKRLTEGTDELLNYFMYDETVGFYNYK